MLAHNMIEYTYNCLKNDDIIFLVKVFCLSLNKKITGKTLSNRNTKFLETIALRILKMSLINYGINIILTWSADCVISSATRVTKP